jgi:hypothetical protein
VNVGSLAKRVADLEAAARTSGPDLDGLLADIHKLMGLADAPEKQHTGSKDGAALYAAYLANMRQMLIDTDTGGEDQS